MPRDTRVQPSPRSQNQDSSTSPLPTPLMCHDVTPSHPRSHLALPELSPHLHSFLERCRARRGRLSATRRAAGTKRRRMGTGNAAAGQMEAKEARENRGAGGKVSDMTDPQAWERDRQTMPSIWAKRHFVRKSRSCAHSWRGWPGGMQPRQEGLWQVGSPSLQGA